MKLAVDLVVQRGDKYLFIRRKNPPFQNELALPGGFVEEDETVIAAARRETKEETGVCLEYKLLRLVGVFSAVARDPRQRVVSIAYHVNVPENTEAHAGSDAEGVCWLSADEALSQELAFDHGAILKTVHNG